MRVRCGIYIDRPPTAVFDFVADHANDVRWRAEITGHERVGEIASGVGAHIRQTVAYQGRVAQLSIEVTDHVPPERICFRVHGKTRAHGCYEFTPEGDGTRFAVAITVELKGSEAMLERYVRQALDQAVEADLARLKRVLETGAPGGSL